MGYTPASLVPDTVEVLRYLSSLALMPLSSVFPIFVLHTMVLNVMQMWTILQAFNNVQWETAHCVSIVLVKEWQVLEFLWYVLVAFGCPWFLVLCGVS